MALFRPVATSHATGFSGIPRSGHTSRARAIASWSASSARSKSPSWRMSVASTRFWNRLGASQLQRSICCAAAHYAVQVTLGARISQPYEDIQHSKLVIIWGHNPVSTAPHFRLTADPAIACGKPVRMTLDLDYLDEAGMPQTRSLSFFVNGIVSTCID